ncbi:unnamed protein product [Scytosiphon promiscuus]
MGGEEQALMYTLEEISGSDYCLQQDTLGGSQVRGIPGMVSYVHCYAASLLGMIHCACPRLFRCPSGGVVPVDIREVPLPRGGTRDGSPMRDRCGSSYTSPFRQAPPAEAAPATATGKSPADPPLSAERGDTGDRAGDGADGGGGGDPDAADKQPKKKRRRGQGKKKRAAEAAAARAAAAVTGVVPGAEPTVVPSGTVDGGRIAGGGAVVREGPSLASVGAAVVEAAAGQTAEAVASAADDDEDGGEASFGGQKGRRDWELGAEDAAKMAPWMYLGVELHPALLWHLHRQGFHDPTPIQRRVLPKAVLGRKDIIGAAETGSGKTLAFGLPVLSEILTRRDAAAAEEDGGEGSEQGLQALVLCPTRELALQVAAHLREVVRDTGVAVVGSGAGAGSTAKGKGKKGKASGEEDDAVTKIMKRLCSIKSLQMEKDVHAYLFCATYPGRTLIFVNAIAIARRLSALLCTLDIPATPLHAQMQQRQRLKSLDRFTSDPKAVLVATDVAARGLDIPKVEHVVHYDAARSAEVFIHRAGRTARARAAGLSLSIVAPRDDANHRQTCSVLGLHDGMQAFPQDMRMVERARERVGMALRVLKFQEAQSRVSASNDFFRGLSKEADLVMDGDLLMDDAGAKPDPAAQGRGGVKGLGKKGNQHAARLAAEARQALAVRNTSSADRQTPLVSAGDLWFGCLMVSITDHGERHTILPRRRSLLLSCIIGCGGCADMDFFTELPTVLEAVVFTHQ